MKTETIKHFGWTITLARHLPDGYNKAWTWEATKPNGGAIVGYRPTRDGRYWLQKMQFLRTTTAKPFAQSAEREPDAGITKGITRGFGPFFPFPHSGERR